MKISLQVIVEKEKVIQIFLSYLISKQIKVGDDNDCTPKVK